MLISRFRTPFLPTFTAEKSRFRGFCGDETCTPCINAENDRAHLPVKTMSDRAQLNYAFHSVMDRYSIARQRVTRRHAWVLHSGDNSGNIDVKYLTFRATKHPREGSGSACALHFSLFTHMSIRIKIDVKQ